MLAGERGLCEAELYYWYHTVDLGRGLVTPGVHDYGGASPTFTSPKT